MKYIIVGAGPTGLSLAYALALNHIEIDIIEKDTQLGGSWNSQWIEDKYFSENAPRVFSYHGNTKKLMNHIGMTNKDFADIYGNFFQTNLKFFYFIYQFFELKDYFIFLLASIKYKFIRENITLQTWLDQSNMSLSGKKAVKILSILVCDTSSNTNINDFFGTITLASFKQMREPNKWHELIVLALNYLPHVHVYRNTTVVNILHELNSTEVTGVQIRHNKTKLQQMRYGDRVVLCTQSSGIAPILNNSSIIVKYNWKGFGTLNYWSKNTYYSGFGFQLHFKEKIEFPSQWCWSCVGSWTVIILPVSNWLKTYSKDPLVQTVWSCCIVDLESMSKAIKKTANECDDKEEVVAECLRQINAAHNIPQPYIITTSEGLKKENDKWLSKNTGFTQKTLGELPMKGYLSNLFALGCFTKKENPTIAYMGSAVNAASDFLKHYEPNLRYNIFS